MASRLTLHEFLLKLTDNGNVYYQPPSNIKMKYPCIRYSLSGIKNTMADDRVYTQTRVYNLLVIDSDPDSIIVDKVSKVPGISFDRQYVSEGLYHTSFRLNNNNTFTEVNYE